MEPRNGETTSVKGDKEVVKQKRYKGSKNGQISIEREQMPPQRVCR
jgi:hypothetical protein